MEFGQDTPYADRSLNHMRERHGVVQHLRLVDRACVCYNDVDVDSLPSLQGRNRDHEDQSPILPNVSESHIHLMNHP